MRRLTLLLFCAAFTLLLTACDQFSPDQSGTVKEANTKTTPDASDLERTTPLKKINRLTQNVTVHGSFEPGKPIKITLRANAHLKTDKVKIRLYLPELAALRQGEHAPGKPDVTVLPINEQLPAAVEANRTMDKGQSLRREVTVRPEKPGYYMVSAAVWAPGAEALTNEGVPVDNGQSVERWIWVSEDGGRVTSKLVPDLFPKGYYIAPGPLTPKDEPLALQPVTHKSSNQGNAQQQLQKTSSESIVFKFTRFNPVNGKVEPIPGQQVRVKEEDQYGSDVNRYTTTTDGDGTITHSCDQYSTYEITATMDASGGGITVLDNYGSPTTAVGRSYEAACGILVEARASAAQYFTWREMLRVKERSESFYGGLSRGGIGVKLDSTADRSEYKLKYNGDDVIVLDESTYETSSLVDFDLFTMAHEYGHAYHEKAIGGYATDGDCPNPHYLDGAYDLDCAFTEGYADFHGAVTVADSNFYKFLFENTPDTYNYPADAPNDNDELSTDGSVIEATFAALLYDLTDPKNESHDSQDLPGSYIADVLGTCHLQGDSGYFYKANGADHLVACFQDQTPPYDEKYDGSNYYFQTRSISLRADGFFDEEANEPAGWSRPAIKDIWYWTLYTNTP